jgi:hypothetical protein
VLGVFYHLCVGWVLVCVLVGVGWLVFQVWYSFWYAICCVGVLGGLPVVGVLFNLNSGFIGSMVFYLILHIGKRRQLS